MIRFVTRTDRDLHEVAAFQADEEQHEMPFFIDKEEWESGKAKDNGALAKERISEGRPTDASEVGRPYRHAKASVPMLEGQTDYIRVANDDPKIDDYRAKTTRGQGWEKYEEGEVDRLKRKAEREAKKAAAAEEKAAKAAEKEAAKAAKAEEAAAKKAAKAADAEAKKAAKAAADEAKKAAKAAEGEGEEKPRAAITRKKGEDA